jgi:tetratricopeptide (TPR) repeat protein
MIHGNMENYDQALKDFSEAIRLDPKVSFLYRNRGIIYYKIENMNQAIIEYTKAIEINPKFAIAYG